uniref:Uncharacterized protein n=1 Tax=viral metagenome TaxID=1070528 RepID=A0A6C0J8J1_9ZZZZ
MANQFTDKQSQNFEKLDAYITKLVDDSINKAKKNIIKDIGLFTDLFVSNMSENELGEFTANLSNSKSGDSKKKSDPKKTPKKDAKKPDSLSLFMKKYEKFQTFKKEDDKVLNLETLKFIKRVNAPKTETSKYGVIKVDDKKISVTYNTVSDKKLTNLYEYLYDEDEEVKDDKVDEKIPTDDEKEDEDDEDDEDDDDIKLSD